MTSNPRSIFAPQKLIKPNPSPSAAPAPGSRLIAIIEIESLPNDIDQPRQRPLEHFTTSCNFTLQEPCASFLF
jgi:hypothetical protein